VSARTLILIGCAVVITIAGPNLVLRLAPTPVGPSTSPGRALASQWRRPRLMTLVVFLVTAGFAVAQLLRPALLDQLARSQATVDNGRWWQLVTQLVVQDPLWQVAINLAALLVFGAAAEQLFGPVWWLVLYLAGAAAGEAAALGLSWQPHGAGNSIAVLGLLGGIAGHALLRQRSSAAIGVAALLVLLAGVVLCVFQDIHGPALLAGALIGAIKPASVKPDSPR